MSQVTVMKDILQERDEQDRKWGVQNHHPYKWLAIIGEEKGEADKAMLEADHATRYREQYRKELVQTAATAIAAIECFDRNCMNEEWWRMK